MQQEVLPLTALTVHHKYLLMVKVELFLSSLMLELCQGMSQQYNQSWIRAGDAVSVLWREKPIVELAIVFIRIDQ